MIYVGSSDPPCPVSGIRSLLPDTGRRTALHPVRCPASGQKQRTQVGDSQFIFYHPSQFVIYHPHSSFFTTPHSSFFTTPHSSFFTTPHSSFSTTLTVHFLPPLTVLFLPPLTVHFLPPLKVLSFRSSGRGSLRRGKSIPARSYRNPHQPIL